MDLFTRVPENPVVTPETVGAGDKVYNPGVIRDRATGKYIMFLRVHVSSLPRWPAKGSLFDRTLSFILSFYVRDEWHSQIWRGESDDGIHWAGFSPFLVPDRLDESQLRGFEDPRVVWVEGLDMYVLTYAAYDGETPTMCVATSTNLVDFTFYGPMPNWPFVGSGGVHIDWKGSGKYLRAVNFNPDSPHAPDVRSKSGSAVPKLIGGRVHFVLGEGGMWGASCLPDMTGWQITQQPLLTGRPTTDLPDNVTVEAGPPPMWRPYGWLVFYHGINKQRQYQLMMAVLSHDLTRVLWRSDFAIMSPREDYEVAPDAIDVIPGAREALSAGNTQLYDQIIADAVANGMLPRVVFTTACEEEGEVIRITYGTRDRVVCVATAAAYQIEELIPHEIRHAA